MHVNQEFFEPACVVVFPRAHNYPIRFVAHFIGQSCAEICFYLLELLSRLLAGAAVDTFVVLVALS